MSTEQLRQQEFALRTTQERRLKFVRLWFTDIFGSLKSVALSPTELEQAFSEGVGVDGSSVYGVASPYECDSLAIPDPASFEVLPWQNDDQQQHTARIFCNIHNPDGNISAFDSRHILRSQIDRIRKSGYSCYVNSGIEFFLVQNIPEDGTEPIPSDTGGYFDQTINESAPNFRRLVVEALEAMGIPVEFSHHESAPGQQEIDLRYADALSTADNVMTFKYIVKVVAYNNGVHATFMPKPYTRYSGSAMHSYFSLFDSDDRNIFYAAEDELFISEKGKSFIAGILAHAREISALTNQWTNSYRRLIRGGEAPFTTSWGANNKAVLVRVPRYRGDASSHKRVEVRTPDPACNPYLAFAVILAAGMKGIQENYQLSPESPSDLEKYNYVERKKLGYQDLPQNLSEALLEMEKSELVANTIGAQVFEAFLRAKWGECKEQNSEVTSDERKKYLVL